MERKCVYDALRYGRENAMPSKTLAQALGFGSVRELQKAVEQERAAGAVILSDTTGGGYYLSNDPVELRRFTRTLYARARNTMKAAESAQRALDAATGQLRISGWFDDEQGQTKEKPPLELEPPKAAWTPKAWRSLLMTSDILSLEMEKFNGKYQN